MTPVSHRETLPALASSLQVGTYHMRAMLKAASSADAETAAQEILGARQILACLEPPFMAYG